MKKKNLLHLTGIMLAGGLLAVSVLATLVPGDAEAHHRCWHAGDATISQNFSFGTFGVSNNAAQHSIVVGHDGSFSHDPAFLPISNPVRAQVLLQNIGRRATAQESSPCIPNTVITVTGASTTLTLNGSGSGNFLTLTDFTSNEPVLDANGNATLNVGTTLRTSGNGSAYNNGNYSGTASITINYQ